MSFFGNSAINRVNLHYAIQAIAAGAGGVFVLAFLLKAGVSVPLTLLTQAGLVAGRFVSDEMALRCVFLVDGALHFALFLVGRRVLTTERLESARAEGIAGAGVVVS